MKKCLPYLYTDMHNELKSYLPRKLLRLIILWVRGLFSAWVKSWILQTDCYYIYKMQVSRNNTSMECSVFNFSLVAILYWYSKNEIPGAALELLKLKIEQCPPVIIKFSTKHVHNHLALTFFKVSWAFFYLYFMQVCFDWVPITFGTRVIKKTAGSARVSRLSFRFLWPRMYGYDHFRKYLPLTFQILIVKNFVFISALRYVLKTCNACIQPTNYI